MRGTRSSTVLRGACGRPRTSASNSASASDKLAAAVKQHGAPGLFWLDLKLPDTTGVSGVVAVKLAYPDVPIAVYSTSPSADMEEACIEAGADTYIEKSASSAELTAALRGLLMADTDAEEWWPPPTASCRSARPS